MFELTSPDLEKVIKDMQQLAPKLQQRALLSALRKAARPIAKSAREKAPKDTGFMASYIAVRANPKLGRSQGGRAVSIGLRGGAKEYVDSAKNRARVIKRGKNKNKFIPSRVGQEYMHGGDAWYFRLLEFGTSKMAARPFLRPAMAENIQNATTIVQVELSKAITRIVETGK
jgi:HK97 gp10 family phage protein